MTVQKMILTMSQAVLDMGYSLRHALPSDLRELLRLERSSQMEDQWEQEKFEEILSLGLPDIVVAEASDGHLAGYVAVGRLPDKDLYYSLVVDSRDRRKGVGRELLFPQRQVSAVAMVRESDLHAQLFLKACGWKWSDTESEDGFVNPTEPAYVFVRPSPLCEDIIV